MKLSAIWETSVGMGAAALRSFLRTMALLLGMGLVLGAVTYYWLMGGFHIVADRWCVFCAIVSVAVMLECLLVGIALAAKRAVAMALVHGVREQHLARATVRLLFERLLGISAEQSHGERGGVVAQVAERVPLAALEERVNDVVVELLDADATRGGLLNRMRGRLQRTLLSAVRAGTLARFRQADADHGGVDLVAVQTELEATIDEQLVRKFKSGVNLLTAIALVFLPAQVAAGNFLLMNLLHGPHLN